MPDDRVLYGGKTGLLRRIRWRNIPPLLQGSRRRERKDEQLVLKDLGIVKEIFEKSILREEFR
ncbi:hypothetical protein AZH53_10375 [Methanomicrobiaceae archaeon CYW5]|nr:hypothetical protein [Methanovulcanius yangii]